jgi:hypothetical protein
MTVFQLRYRLSDRACFPHTGLSVRSNRHINSALLARPVRKTRLEDLPEKCLTSLRVAKAPGYLLQSGIDVELQHVIAVHIGGGRRRGVQKCSV